MGVETKVERRIPVGHGVMVTLIVSSMSAKSVSCGVLHVDVEKSLKSR